MELNSVRYTAVALAGVNKTAELEQDGDGYYRVLLGALNVFNSEGKFYALKESEKAFDQSSDFMRRVSDGNLHGEEDHPAFLPGMTEEAYIARNEWIETKNVACHIREVELVPTDELCNDLPVVEIWGWVKPDRDRGPYLKAALDNPHQNVCFSLRALVYEKTLPNGQVIRAIAEMFTFDWVIEDGLRICNKYSSIKRGGKVAQESTKTFSDVRVTRNTLEKMLTAESGGKTIAQESHRLHMVDRARQLLRTHNHKTTHVRQGLGNGGW